nr:tetratricopeptide repeat protein [Desulfobaculum xiamenense]
MFGGLRKLRERTSTVLDEKTDDAPEANGDITPQDAMLGRDAFVSGNAAYARSDYETAIPEYRECLRILPRHSEARQRLGYCLYRAGQHLQAKIEFERVLRERGGRDNFSSLYLGLTLAQMGKRDKAAEAWRGYFNPEEVRIMRELNVQTALIESSEDYPLEDAVECVEEAIAARKEELLAGEG